MESWSCTIRMATSLVFSWGFFFEPGSLQMLRLRLSAYCSEVSTRIFPSLAFERTRSSTTSTTRTSFLCAVASSISRAAPLWTSSASWESVLASSLPNFVMSMLWSVSIWPMISGDRSISSSCELLAVPSMFATPVDRTFSSSHHSKRIVQPEFLSWIVNHLARKCGLDSSVRLRVSLFPFLCSLFSRSMSSRRRWATPSLGPTCRRASASAASAAGASGACGSPCMSRARPRIQTCEATASALARRSSSLQSMPRR
mmetsp:Transcript_32904/g.104287  ORF Transcript_32904/g.104287 Transcript_32904/m.104287 type:complete len:257 (-) Transcript_32904:842-1612(-)